jgi:hypothetical protein
MGILIEIQNLDVIQLDVQILVDRLKGAADADIVLKLDGDGMVGESLEEAAL